MIHFTEYLDTWQPLNVSSVLVDSTISNFEAVHVSREISNGFATAKDYCLSGKKCFSITFQSMLACENETSGTVPSLSPHPI